MTKFNPLIHHRRSIRLPAYDYSMAGAYFVTLVTHQRACLFGELKQEAVKLNELGQIARREWFRAAEIRPFVELYEDEFVVMPNHVHGIIWIKNVGAVRCTAQGAASPHPYDDRESETKSPQIHPPSLGVIVRAYKSAVTYAANRPRGQRGAVLWQRNYYEHIIRDDNDLKIKHEYILNNPFNWELDDEFIST